jgi:small subunit ribosomal protein S18
MEEQQGSTAAPVDAESEVRDAPIVLGPESKARPRRKKKISFLTQHRIDVVDYKDVPVLKRFINERGKILSSRQTGNTAKQQRMVAIAIRRARELALLPYVSKDVSSDRREQYKARQREMAAAESQASADPEVKAEQSEPTAAAA